MARFRPDGSCPGSSRTRSRGGRPEAFAPPFPPHTSGTPPDRAVRASTAGPPAETCGSLERPSKAVAGERRGDPYPRPTGEGIERSREMKTRTAGATAEVPVWPEKRRELHNHHFDSTIWNDFGFRDDDVV